MASIGAKKVPSEGDISICVHCKEVSLFATQPQLHRRKPTARESEALAQMPDLQEVLKKVRAIPDSVLEGQGPSSSTDPVVDRWMQRFLRTENQEAWDKVYAEMRAEFPDRIPTDLFHLLGPSHRVKLFQWRNGEKTSGAVICANLAFKDLNKKILEVLGNNIGNGVTMIMKGAAAAGLGHVKVAGIGEADGMERDVHLVAMDDLAYTIFMDLMSHISKRSYGDPT